MPEPSWWHVWKPPVLIALSSIGLVTGIYLAAPAVFVGPSAEAQPPAVEGVFTFPAIPPDGAYEQVEHSGCQSLQVKAGEGLELFVRVFDGEDDSVYVECRVVRKPVD